MNIDSFNQNFYLKSFINECNDVLKEIRERETFEKKEGLIELFQSAVNKINF